MSMGPTSALLIDLAAADHSAITRSRISKGQMTQASRRAMGLIGVLEEEQTGVARASGTPDTGVVVDGSRSAAQWESGIFSGGLASTPGASLKLVAKIDLHMLLTSEILEWVAVGPEACWAGG